MKSSYIPRCRKSTHNFISLCKQFHILSNINNLPGKLVAHDKALSCRFHTPECMKFTITACQYLVISFSYCLNNSLPSAQSSIAYLQDNVPWLLDFRNWTFFHSHLEGFVEDDCSHCAFSGSHFGSGSLVKSGCVVVRSDVAMEREKTRHL